jgi:transposase, IS30 family
MQNKTKRVRIGKALKKVAQRSGRERPLLSLADRGKIELRYCTDRWTLARIATELGRNKGTISREIGGAPRAGRYRYSAHVAHKKACVRIEKRGNISKMSTSPPLREYVISKLKTGWSPEQISGRLDTDYKGNTSMQISYEAIYQYVYSTIDSQGKPRKGTEDLRVHLSRRHPRRSTKGARTAQKLERLSSLPSIEARPPVVETRTRVGDWEDDFVVSRESISQVKSVNERRIGVFFFRKTTGRTAEEGDAQVIQCLSTIPPQFRLTLTRDRGPENKAYESLQKALSISIYFAHPYCSHERGSNENGNGLLRRFFPKKTNWDMITDEELHRVEYLINTRPRKRLGYQTPAERYLLETGVALYS